MGDLFNRLRIRGFNGGGNDFTTRINEFSYNEHYVLLLIHPIVLLIIPFGISGHQILKPAADAMINFLVQDGGVILSEDFFNVRH